MSKKHKKGRSPAPAFQVQGVAKKTDQPAVAEPRTIPSSGGVSGVAKARPPASPAGQKGTKGDMRSIEQRRAEFALQRLEDALAVPEAGKYKHSQLKSYLRRLPAMIQMNGFGQALAFYYAKRTNYEAYGVVYKLLEDWLCAKGQVYASATGVECALNPQATPYLLRALTAGDQQAYRRAEAEAQALLSWAKKFAEALILKDADAGDD